MNPSNLKTGIRDWPAKQALLRALYDVLSNKALVQAIVEGWVTEPHDLMDNVEKCYETFRRWDRSKPVGTRSQQFWNQVIRDKEPQAGMVQLWVSSITEFVDFFKDNPDVTPAVGELLADSRASLGSAAKAELQNRFALLDGLQANLLPVAAEAPNEEYHLRGHLQMIFEGPQTGIDNGRVQSTQFYQVPEAARAWAAMVDSANYRMYLDCLLSLKELVKSKHWALAVGSGKYDAAVTLGGGGSPEKDWVFATSLLSALRPTSPQLQYFVNDISPYMIQHSVRFLHRRFKKNQLDQEIKIVYDWSDFLKLDLMFRRPDCQALVWSIFGGTIGNVSELNFFRSLNGRSRGGDLLVVGVDTIDNESAQDLADRMTAEYRSKELDALLLAPVHGATASPHGPRPVVNVAVHAHVHGETNNRSDVPNSRTAVFSIPSRVGNAGETVLAHSTRYVLEDFLTYARQFGWEHLGTTPPPSESTFRQLLLRRTE